MRGNYRNVLLTLSTILTVAVLGAGWWFVFSGDERPTCETVQTDYDFVATLTGHSEATGSFDPKPVNTVMDVRVSGKDIHVDLTDKDGEAEGIYVDGAFYERPKDGEWVETEINPEIGGFDLKGYLDYRVGYGGSSDNILCPDIGAAVVVGEETIGDVSAVHYQLVDTAVGAYGDPHPQPFPGYDMTWDFWLDDTGLLLKSQLLQTITGRPEAIRGETTIVISGIGDPNIIEAPL